MLVLEAGRYRLIAIMMPNAEHGDRCLESSVVKMAEVEKRTGLKFLPARCRALAEEHLRSARARARFALERSALDGDLDGDGKVDRYMDPSDHRNVSKRTMSLSAPAARGQVVKKVAIGA